MSWTKVMLAAAIGLLAGCGGGPVGGDYGIRIAAEDDGDHWLSYGRTYSENHYSPLAEISTKTVGQLGLAWYQDLDTPLRADSQPLEDGGVVYVATGLSVVQAFDAVTGKRLWRHDPEVAKVAGAKLLPSWGIRGLALWNGKVIVGTQDGRLIALDARNGDLMWSVQTLDSRVDRYGEATITGAPRVLDGKVLIGFAGAERGGVRSAVHAFDAETGKFLWRFYTVPGDPAAGFEDDAMAMAAKTWSGKWWDYGGGGTAWNAITYDPEYKRVYIGTGNGGPWNWKIRNPDGGDALFLNSIIALDAETGKYIWHYQQNPNEAWDYNAAMDIALVTLTIDGRPRKVLMQAPKNGFFYVIDRETGKLVSAEAIGRVNWASGIDLASGRPIEKPDIRYEKGPVLMWPGTYGTHNWQPMAFSPQTGLAYIPTIQQADVYSAEGIDPKSWQREPNSWNVGMSTSGTGSSAIKVPTEEFRSYLQAWDPVTQRAVWKIDTPGIVNGGTMATGGGLVFQGHLDGSLNAFNARSGKRLWRFDAGVSVLGAPISFRAGGRQYVSVVVGPPSGSPSSTLPQQAKFGWRYDHPRRLLTFAIGGNATLPAGSSAEPAVPIKDGGFRVDAAKATQGAAIFNGGCMACHGVGAVASGGAPDLRASAAPFDAESFREVVKGGILLDRGMPRFPEMSEPKLDALRHYIRAQASAPSATVERAHGP